MNQHSDTDRVLRRWFEDGPNTMPDRVVGVVAERIGRQPQRRYWRLRGRPFMNRYVKLAAGLAAAIAVVVVGWQLLPGRGGIGGPKVSPSPTPGVTASVKALPDGSLAPGDYELRPFQSTPSLSVRLTAPAGWQGFQSWALIGPNGTGAPSGIGIGLLKVDAVFQDPCHWDKAGSGLPTQADPVAIGPTVDDLVNALRANRSYTSSAPVDVVMHGLPARRLDLQLPTTDFAAACDNVSSDPSGSYFVFTGHTGEASLYAQGPGARWQVTVLQVGGSRVVVVLDDYAATAPADRSAAEAIIDSMVFAP
jgi:hypothetical protein